MTQQIGRDGRVLESGDLIRVGHLDTPTETELKEWSQYVESVKKLIQAGARAGDGWVVNEKWGDVKDGRAFFIGDMYLPPKKQHPIPEPVSPASHQPPQAGPSAQAQPLTLIEAAREILKKPVFRETAALYPAWLLGCIFRERTFSDHP
ncbi:hypothetical protein [Pseudomonas fluvialis]|uniref:Uncharacterized protein n=1 Tax=Pseudomonas fluvialis TaxID=1793966 RepID=A0ABQ2AVR5_9PSED|nr:hypothetical protein [Pseudomonas fluvialis]GGH97266.1 hypothetical protein GCM10007363_30780 [Pseudomonas fluvialis]